MSKVLFQRVTILGLGLMGGCLALELKRRGLAKRVVGFNRSARRRRIAKQRGLCDETYGDAKSAVQGADLVVFAMPVQQIPLMAKQVAPSIASDAIVTDLGSTKEKLVNQLVKILPKSCAYVGGHPMAGIEKSGVESAIPELFSEHWWFLTPGDKTQKTRLATVRLKKLILALGAKPKQLSPLEHDEILSSISHLPQCVASTLMETSIHTKKGIALKYIAGGFRDTTRIAASPEQMWTEICLDNAAQLLKQMNRFEKKFQNLKKWIATGNQKKINLFFKQAAQGRKKLN